MLKALQAVEANRGAAGVDGMEVEQLRAHLREHWAEIREQILSGSYEPRSVRRVASHMNAALPTAYFRQMGLISLLDEVLWFTTLRQQRSL